MKTVTKAMMAEELVTLRATVSRLTAQIEAGKSAKVETYHLVIKGLVHSTHVGWSAANTEAKRYLAKYPADNSFVRTYRKSTWDLLKAANKAAA